MLRWTWTCGRRPDQTHLLSIICDMVGPQPLGQNLLVVQLLRLDAPGFLTLSHQLGGRTSPKPCTSKSSD